MSRCLHCGGPLFPGEERCLSCRKSTGGPAELDEATAEFSETDSRRVAVARFQNGAEAGYFADELARTTSIRADVLARERFDGVHAAWSIDYVLLVDHARASQAAGALQSLLESTADDSPDGVDDDAPHELPALWMPMILTLAAGSIACFGIDRAERPLRQQGLVVRGPHETPELWRVLATGRGVWKQTLDDGPGERTLSFDRHTHAAVLTEDRDGDGRPERTWRFDPARTGTE